ACNQAGSATEDAERQDRRHGAGDGACRRVAGTLDPRVPQRRRAAEARARAHVGRRRFEAALSHRRREAVQGRPALMAGQTAIEEEVAALGGLTLSELRERWRELFGAPPPKSLRRAFLVKACAYQIQVRAHGGLSGRTRRKLRRI